MNILDMVKDQLTGAVVEKLGSAVGLGADDVNKAMGAIVPAQLDSLIKMGSSQTGASNLLGMLGNFANMGNIGDLVGKADGIGSMLKMGESVLPALFGKQLGSVVDGVSQATGIGNSSALNNLMKLAGPIVMSVLGRQAKGLNPLQLISLLGGLRGAVNGAMPKGLSGVLSNISGIGDQVGDVTSSVTRGVSTAMPEVKKAGFPWWIPLLLLLGALGLAFSMCNRQSTGTADIGAVSNQTVDAMESVSDGVFRVGNIVDGAELPYGSFDLDGTGTPGDIVTVMDNGDNLGTATVGEDGKWSFTVPSGSAGAHEITISTPNGSETLNVTVGEPTGSAADCTDDFSASMADGQSVSGPFRFGGKGAGEGYTITVKRGARTVGTKDVALDGSCGWSYRSNPGKGPITYEVREMGSSDDAIETINLTVQ